jgi:RimJ/RimL family protein N-acetyltransferase
MKLNRNYLCCRTNSRVGGRREIVMGEKELYTQRLIIRPFYQKDWKDLYEYLSDEEVIRYEPYGVFTAEQCKQEAVQRSKNQAFLAVCLKDSGKVIGNLYFEERDSGTWELGYVFSAVYQNQGYATEAAYAVIDKAFREGRARRVIAMCNPDNKASWRLLERLHMRREGYLKKNIYFKVDENNNPIWQDTFEYGILAEEWS